MLWVSDRIRESDWPSNPRQPWVPMPDPSCLLCSEQSPGLESLPMAPSTAGGISTGDGEVGARPKRIILQGPVLSLIGQRRSSFPVCPTLYGLGVPTSGRERGTEPRLKGPQNLLSGSWSLGPLSSAGPTCWPQRGCSWGRGGPFRHSHLPRSNSCFLFSF